MLQCGTPGIMGILITGKILLGRIPIGTDTNMVAFMTRIFIISTIVARVEVGIRDSIMEAILMNGTQILIVAATMKDENSGVFYK
jgi:hypothetical protein